MGVAVEILLLARLEPEIHLGGKFTPPLVMQRCKKTLDLLGLIKYKTNFSPFKVSFILFQCEPCLVYFFNLFSLFSVSYRC